LRELLRLLTNSEDSKINKFWEEQKKIIVTAKGVRNEENEA
jgi:hypothetical protein